MQNKYCQIVKPIKRKIRKQYHLEKVDKEKWKTTNIKKEIQIRWIEKMKWTITR